MRVVLVALAAATAVSCGLLTGLSKSAAGNWRAPGIGHSGHFFELSLTQSGDRVSGAACSGEAGFLLFAGALVSGDRPDVTFVDPNSGRRFSGKFEEDRDHISGEYGFGAGQIPLRFMRSEGGSCAGTKPFPAAAP